jgi:hypothetical protein
MKSALFIVTSDPRASHRAAEAIRIAAGVAAWKRVKVRVYLRAAAVLALSESTGGLADEDNYRQYLPVLGEVSEPIYVQEGESLLNGLGQASVKYQSIDDRALAALAAESSWVLRF